MRVVFGCILMLVSCLSSAAAENQRIGPELANQISIPPGQRSADILWNKSAAQLETDGHWVYSQYVSVRINDQAAARDYGRIAIPFNHYYSDLALDFAHARSADGVVTAVANDAVQLRVTGGGQDFYSDSSELVFSLPDILPGTIIEFQYRVTSKVLDLAALYSDNVSPYWFQRLVGGDGWRVDHVINHEHSFAAPKAAALYTKTFNGYPKPAKTKTNDTHIVRTWRMTDVDGISYESWLAPFHKVLPQLSISNQTQWSVIADWTDALTVEQMRITPAIKAVADSLGVPADATRSEKARAVYAYMQRNIRYVFAHLGRGGYKPHFAEEVLDASYGDCKDQTILSVALLRALGVVAYPAVVETPRSGRHDTELVAMIFDHMVSYIPADGEEPALWMDTTSDSALYPGLSNYLVGQTALIIDGKGGQLTKINHGFEPNRVIMDMVYDSDETSGISSVDVDITLSGFFEQNMRSWWLHTNNRESDLQLMLKSIFSRAVSENVTTRASDAQDLWTPFRLSARFIFPQQEEVNASLSYATSFSQIFNLFGGFKDLQTPASRQQRFVDHYRYELVQRAHIRIPRDHIAAVIQSDGNKISPYFELIQSGHDRGDEYLIEQSFVKPMLDLSVDQYQGYFDGLEVLTHLSAWVVNAADNSASSKSTVVKNDYNAETIDYALQEIRNDIDTGNFEAALTAAKKVVDSASTNGEAWYLLGMAQGLNTLLEESNRSFEMAAKFGYLP